MCGINLIIDKKKNLNPDLIHKMSALTHHRGPDETRTNSIESKKYTYYLASNRLKITDQSVASAQPFFSSDSKQVLLFNGEIYNFYTLKNELISKNVSFSSHSDTEVLFHWLRIYGHDGIKKLNGMFAFIFIDFEFDKIIIARDRFGIKPIYYFENEDSFIVSSEIKAILGTGLIKRELNVPQIQHYLLYKYAKSPATFFRHIYELQPGSTLNFQKGISHIDCFYFNEIKYNDLAPDLNKIEELIVNSLIQQVNAQVPLGLLLSGGVDSTLLLAMARKEGIAIPTFSIIHSDSERSFGTEDYLYSRKAASVYSNEHHELIVDISLLNDFDDFIRNIDQPIGDSAYLMTSAICQYASKSMKILISGAGADELFAGYNRHKAYYHYLKNKNLLNILIPLLRPIVNTLPTGMHYPWRKQLKLVKKLVNSISKSENRTLYNFLSFNELGIHDELVDKYGNNKNWLDWALNHDQNNYLIHDVLALSDRASMLHGIELRIPYLDSNLVDYISNFHAEMLLKHGQKWILKDMLKKYRGNEFASRSKEGFGLPLSSWLFDKKTEHLWELFQSDKNIIFKFLDKKVFDRLISEQIRKKEDHGPLLWSILVLGHWLDCNF